MSYDIWYAAPNHLGYCRQFGFIDYPHESLHSTNEVVNPGDVYVYRNPINSQEWFVYKLVDERPTHIPFIQNCDSRKDAYINRQDWNKYCDTLVHIVRNSIATPRCEVYLDEVVNSQTPFVHRRVPFLPHKGTWTYAVQAGKTFNFRNSLNLRRVLIEDLRERFRTELKSDPNYAFMSRDHFEKKLRFKIGKALIFSKDFEVNLNPKLRADLANPCIKTLVFVLSGARLHTNDVGKIWRGVKSTIKMWDHDHEVVIWDAETFANVLVNFTNITNEIIRKWYWRSSNYRSAT